MIHFTDKRLYLKGTSEAICTDKATGDIVYYSNKFQTGNVTMTGTGMDLLNDESIKEAYLGKK